MQRMVMEHFSSDPRKLVDLQWLEEELHDTSLDDLPLSWNRRKRCVEHRFSDDWDAEYMVLSHWADHVGAAFELTEETDATGFYSAYIYR